MDGVCAIKPEYLVERKNAATSSQKNEVPEANGGEDAEGDTNIPSCKKIKLEDDPRPEGFVKNKHRGQNKARPKPTKECLEVRPCPTIVNVPVGNDPVPCKYSNCKFIHDPTEYIQNKGANIEIDSGKCRIFDIRGFCQYGLTCRFSPNHITPDFKNVVNEEKFQNWTSDTLNAIKFDLQTSLQKRKYSFDYSDQVIREYDKVHNPKKFLENQKKLNGTENQTQGAVTDEDIIKIRDSEKKKINWDDLLYLSPLTTVGNLPFRRICKEFGADVTCGEMALCESLLKGLKQEWALVKRHSSEDLFGVQICGSNVYLISKTAQLIDENLKVDFVDLNLGCPIELVIRKGAGCGMLLRHGALQSSISCASKVLQVPFTVKTRIGVYQDKKIAHTLVPKFTEWGASLITVHGRSMEQRYTKYANWEYIEECAKEASPCPVFGNGDIFCYDDYLESKKVAPSIKGVMIGRGALIKPWIFNEIKTRKVLDISSSERFEILKKYANYGLEHWGSDTRGVENTRRFMLEWLSFLYRYVPVGLLEQPPQKINKRPPAYFGRDDMETLMASSSCADWIKISEMLLGPVPDGFKFLPKHKANAY